MLNNIGVPGLLFFFDSVQSFVMPAVAFASLLAAPFGLQATAFGMML